MTIRIFSVSIVNFLTLIDVPVGGPVTDESLAEAKLFAACVPGPGIGQLVALQDTLAPYSPVKVKCNVPEETARKVEENSIDWPGVAVEVEPIRDYPTGSLTSNLVGFLGPIPASLGREIHEQRALSPTAIRSVMRGLRIHCKRFLPAKMV